jgi:hypothetical protein
MRFTGAAQGLGTKCERQQFGVLHDVYPIEGIVE